MEPNAGPTAEPDGALVVNVARTLGGEFDHLLVYRKRLRRPLEDYERNVPPHVRAARMADEFHLRQGRPALYRNGGWIRYVMTLAGPEPLQAGALPRQTPALGSLPTPPGTHTKQVCLFLATFQVFAWSPGEFIIDSNLQL